MTQRKGFVKPREATAAKGGAWNGCGTDMQCSELLWLGIAQRRKAAAWKGVESLRHS